MWTFCKRMTMHWPAASRRRDFHGRSRGSRPRSSHRARGPAPRARRASMRPGQVFTMRWMAGSGVRSSRAVAALPATRSSAAAMPPTVRLSEGRLSAVRGPHCASLASAARTMPSTVRAGRGQRHQRLVGHRAGRADAGERLADHAAEEARGRAVGQARAHAHRHQPHAAAADEALARVVGHELLADELLDAVAGLRRGQRVVVDDLGQRLLGRVAEHRERAGEHQHRARCRRCAGVRAGRWWRRSCCACRGRSRPRIRR